MESKSFGSTSGGPARLGNSALQVSGGDEDGRPEEHGTTHVAALDNLGNMVCATPSGGAFAKSVFFPELGFALSTRSEMFNFEEGPHDDKSHGASGNFVLCTFEDCAVANT